MSKHLNTVIKEEKKQIAPWPYFPEEWSKEVKNILLSGRVNYHTGENGKAFEREFATYCDRKYGVAVANGTLALEMALAVYGIGKGDEVIVTPRSFIASASCATILGAKPVFVDIDPTSQNITAETIKKAITPKTKAIIAVHLAGWPCDMDPIMELAKEKGLIVVEDCAQAHGALYKGKKVGSLGDIAAFSFCQDKIITTAGEGGMVLTDSRDIFKKLWALKDHGKDYDLVYNTEHPPGFRWLHTTFGSNYRMTEIQAVIGRLSLKKLDEWVKIRRKNAEMLNTALSKFPSIRTTIPPTDIYHSYYKYYCFVKPEKLKAGWDRDRIMNAINKEGTLCFSGSCSEMYLEKAFQGYNTEQERLPVAKLLGETSLMFLVHPTITEEYIETAIDNIERVLKEATKS